MLKEIDRRHNPDGSTIITVEVGGTRAEALRRYYGGQGGQVKVVYDIREGRWCGVLYVGGFAVHAESDPAETTLFEPDGSGENEWITRLTGGHRMVRHILSITGGEAL